MSGSEGWTRRGSRQGHCCQNRARREQAARAGLQSSGMHMHHVTPHLTRRAGQLGSDWRGAQRLVVRMRASRPFWGAQGTAGRSAARSQAVTCQTVARAGGVLQGPVASRLLAVWRPLAIIQASRETALARVCTCGHDTRPSVSGRRAGITRAACAASGATDAVAHHGAQVSRAPDCSWRGAMWSQKELCFVPVADSRRHRSPERALYDGACANEAPAGSWRVASSEAQHGADAHPWVVSRIQARQSVRILGHGEPFPRTHRSAGDLPPTGNPIAGVTRTLGTLKTKHARPKRLHTCAACALVAPRQRACLSRTASSEGNNGACAGYSAGTSRPGAQRAIPAGRCARRTVRRGAHGVGSSQGRACSGAPALAAAGRGTTSAARRALGLCG